MVNSSSSILTAAASASTATKIVPLHFWTCFFLDSPDGNYASIRDDLIFKCRSQGKYLGGSDPNGFNGHIICIVICVLVYIFGIFGLCSNIVNALVLQKSLKGASDSFKRILIVLAIFEVFACFFSILFATVLIFILENVARGEVIFNFLRYGHILYSFGRVGAIYLTILVTIERYLVVAFPIDAKVWLTPVKSVVYLVAVITLAVMLDIPWIFNTEVSANRFLTMAPKTSLEDFPYILKTTQFGRVVYPHVRNFQLVMNYIIPFPLILLFNALLYRSIFKWNHSRMALSKTQKKEISTSMMFSIVVLVLLLCHAVSCVIVFLAQYQKIVYRELMMLQILAVTISAAVNFVVYYICGRAYREEFQRLMGNIWRKITGHRGHQEESDEFREKNGLPSDELRSHRASRSMSTVTQTEKLKIKDQNQEDFQEVQSEVDDLRMKKKKTKANFEQEHFGHDHDLDDDVIGTIRESKEE